jgi:thiol-disulfide isomerase/thioredoxin
MLGLVLGTVVVLGAIAVFAVAKSGSSTATPSTPNVTPGTPIPTPITGPVPGIGILDPSSGTASVAKRTPKVGSMAPDFAWRTTTGQTRLSTLRGHTVLLEFYGVWCPACQSAVPMLNGLLTDYGSRGLVVLSVTGSPRDFFWESTGSAATVGMNDLYLYKTRLGVQYQQILDAGTRVFNMYGFGQSFPTYYVIDRKAIVRFGISTAISSKDLTAQVKAAL